MSNSSFTRFLAACIAILVGIFFLPFFLSLILTMFDVLDQTLPRGNDQLSDPLREFMHGTQPAPSPSPTPSPAAAQPPAAPADYTGLWIFIGCVAGLAVLICALILLAKFASTRRAWLSAQSVAKQAEIATGQLIFHFPSDTEIEQQVGWKLLEQDASPAACAYTYKKVTDLLDKVREHQRTFGELTLQPAPTSRKDRAGYYAKQAAKFKELGGAIETDAKMYGQLLSVPANVPKHALSAQTGTDKARRLAPYSPKLNTWLHR